ncbi:MAG: hypothetical protein KDA84_07200 [Planctomycetaceae bacterium]|nr:hypothetical protein [Planctomycetaceae bacterium]
MSMREDKYYSIRLPFRNWCIVAYLASLFLPAETPSGETVWCVGFYILFASLAHIGFIYLTFCWLANLLFWIAVFINPRAARVLSALAGIIALSPLLNDFTRSLVTTHYFLPYFLWMGSIFLFALACHLEPRTLRSQQNTSTQEREIGQDRLDPGILGIPLLLITLCGLGLLVVLFSLIFMALITAAVK